MVDKCVNLSTRDYGQAEDIHMSLGHIITYMVKERVRKEAVTNKTYINV
jgi:D-sedoheptulose 7-phosphate isomerase